MIEEVVKEVEIMYIQNTSGNNYSVETTGRRTQTVKLNFAKVDGIEIDAKRPLELRSSFLQLGEKEEKIWNMRFVYPTNFKIKYSIGKIIIEVL